MQDASFESIDTARLRLRRFDERDVAPFAAYRADAEVARYQAWQDYSEEEAARFIASLRDAVPGKPGEWFQFAVARRGDDVLIGDCALRCWRNDARQAELGFSFASEHQGGGFAREAVGALLGYAFGVLRLRRIIAITDERNRRAQALLEGLGFRREGRFVKSTWFKGGFSNELLYALLVEEWLSTDGTA